MKKFCIVIPIYKEHLNCTEKISLKRYWEIIKDKNYSTYFVRPNCEFNMKEYYDLIPGWEGQVFEHPFDESYFKSTITYSKLCINYDFYNTFSEYEYMYIYQLDCYIITDYLEQFANICDDRKIDYIGAPIISTNCGWETLKELNGKKIFMPKVGNGGFSIRRISKFKEITDLNGEYIKYYNINQEDLNKVKFEDLYFCEEVYKKYNINIPHYRIGLKFAWDMNVDIIYDKWNIKKLPMAIHAWDKNIRLWSKLLPELINNEEVINFCEEKYKDFFKIYYNDNNSSAR